MEITKGKIFMNLEIKDSSSEIWEKIQELIEKYEYYDQISICKFDIFETPKKLFNNEFYEQVQKYNKEYNRKIVFGFLKWTPLKITYQPNNQISLFSGVINRDVVNKIHDKGMTVGVWFLKEPEKYYDLFDIGVDVIITDYPLKVQNQLNEYYSDKAHLEGCKSIEKNDKNITSCVLCESGYELVRRREEERNLCKLKYEIDPDLFIRDDISVFREKNIFAIKMLYDPIYNQTICQKNGKRIFYFEWLFDLYGYDYGVYDSYYMHELYHCYEKNIYYQIYLVIPN